MDSFSTAAVDSACETISHRLISTGSELDELIKSGDPASHGVQKLLALSASLSAFRQAVEALRESIQAAMAVSPVLQSSLRASLQPCSDASATIEKGIIRLLQPGFTVDAIDMDALLNYENHQATNAQLFALLAQILQIGSSEAQDGAFASLNGAQLLEKAVTSSQHVIARSNALGGLLASNITPLDSAQVQSPESPLSPSSACQGTKGESKASSGFLATLSDSFRAVTTNLLAKPEPMVIAFCQTAKDGDVRHLKGFVSQGVNVNGRNEEGHTALICATRANQLDAIKYLVAAGADIAAKDTHSGQRQPPLFHAAECGHLEAAEMLMDLGANIHEVAWFNQPFFARVTDSDNLAMIEMFLDRGADPNATRNNGRTVVIDAIRSGSLDRLRLLHEHGGKITTRDITGQPPLHMALGQNRIDIIDFLLAHGADPSSTDNVGKSLLHAALQRKLYGLVKNLLIRGANPNVSDHMGTTFLATLVNDTTADDEMGPDLVRMVLTKGGNPNQPDSWGEPLLCRVMEKGNTKLLRAFLEHRANPNKDFRRLGTLLLYALDHGRYDHALLLLKHGADPNKADGKGRTPLLEALQMEAIPVVKELLAVGADVNLGGTVKPLQFARALGNQELVQLFLAGGAENPTRPAASISCSGIGGVRAVHFPLEPPGAGQSSQVEEEVPPAYSETHSS